MLTPSEATWSFTGILLRQYTQWADFICWFQSTWHGTWTELHHSSVCHHYWFRAAQRDWDRAIAVCRSVMPDSQVFRLQCDLSGLIYCRSTVTLIISAKRMTKINILLLIKRYTEAAAAVPMIVLDSSKVWFAACFDGLSILHRNITLIYFTSNNPCSGELQRRNWSPIWWEQRA